MHRLYIYGVVNDDQPLTFDVDGLAGGLRIVGEGDIGAIVGTAPELDLETMPRDTAVRLLNLHQQVLEAAMAQTTVLPVKFGAVAPDEQAVRRMLVQGQDLLSAQLTEFTDHLQMEIVVLWRLDQVFAEIATERDIAELQSKALTSGGDDERRRLDRAVKAALERRRASLSDEICDVLGTVATDMATKTHQDDRVAADVALLLNKTDMGSLEGMLNRLDAELAGEVNFRAIGPQPLASFATVEVAFPEARTIDWARRTLGLGEKINRGDITTAFHRLCGGRHGEECGRLQNQPCKDDVAKAYRFLMAYAQTQHSANEERDWLVDASVAADMVMINIIRQEMQRSPYGALGSAIGGQEIVA